MSAANKLVLHHTYDRGTGFDVSEYGNHGQLRSVAAGAGAFAGSLRFAGGPSWVYVRPSPTLTDMRAIRVRMRFLVSAPKTSGRHNLMEGHLSFALFVNSDWSIQGTILDATDTWSGPISPPGAVSSNQWHVVEYMHDGVSHARIFIDGTKVAETFDAPGPIRNVESDGLAIGHWPHPNSSYTLDGYIDDARLWVYDPKKDVRRLLDECCFDRAGIDRFLTVARAKGWDAARWTALVRDILDLGTEIAVAARDGSPARTVRAAQLTREGMLAVMAKDPAALHDVFTRLRTYALERLTPAQLDAYGQRALAQIQSSPLAAFLFGSSLAKGDPIRRLAALLCLDGLLPPDRKPERDDHDRPPRRPDGDPDTDGPTGKPPDDWRLGGEDSLPADGGRPQPDEERPRRRRPPVATRGRTGALRRRRGDDDPGDDR